MHVSLPNRLWWEEETDKNTMNEIILKKKKTQQEVQVSVRSLPSRWQTENPSTVGRREILRNHLRRCRSLHALRSSRWTGNPSVATATPSTCVGMASVLVSEPIFFFSYSHPPPPPICSCFRANPMKACPSALSHAMSSDQKQDMTEPSALQLARPGQ